MTATLRRLFVVLAAISLVAAACGDDDGGADEVADAVDELVDEADAGDLANLSGDCLEASAAVFGAMGGAAAAMMGDTSELEEGAEALEKFAEDAPDEIGDDLAVVAAAVKRFVEGLGDMNFDPSSGDQPSEDDLEQLMELGEAFEDEEVSEASDRLTEWFAENCEGASGE